MGWGSGISVLLSVEMDIVQFMRRTPFGIPISVKKTCRKQSAKKIKISLDILFSECYDIQALERAARAGVAELADARDLKSRGSNPVPVRSRSPALTI